MNNTYQGFKVIPFGDQVILKLIKGWRQRIGGVELVSKVNRYNVGRVMSVGGGPRVKRVVKPGDVVIQVIPSGWAFELDGEVYVVVELDSLLGAIEGLNEGGE